jgi:hypothetical protein
MGPVRRAANFACALALIGVGSYLLLIVGLTHGRLHGHLGMVAAVMTVLGGYWLWENFIKATPNKEG